MQFKSARNFLVFIFCIENLGAMTPNYNYSYIQTIISKNPKMDLITKDCDQDKLPIFPRYLKIAGKQFDYSDSFSSSFQNEHSSIISQYALYIHKLNTFIGIRILITTKIILTQDMGYYLLNVDKYSMDKVLHSALILQEKLNYMPLIGFILPVPTITANLEGIVHQFITST